MVKKSVFHNYSIFNPEILEEEGRLDIARQISRVLSFYLGGKDTKYLTLLDIGCSSGVISNYFSKMYGKVVAIDVDNTAVDYAKRKFRRRNLEFLIKDGSRTHFPDSSFDVVVANQVYYCFKNPQRFFNEVYRVLKPGGICFLGARNKYTLWDPQYHLPLLALMPKKVADFFVKVMGRSEKFDVQYRTYWQLEKMCRRFSIEKVTPKAIHNCRKYGFKKFENFGFFFSLFPESVWVKGEPLLPNFVWVLEKPEQY